MRGCGWRVRGLGGFRREGRAAGADLDQGEQPAAGRLDRGAGEVVAAEEGAVLGPAPREADSDEPDAGEIAGGAERAPDGGSGDEPTFEGAPRNEAGDAPPKNAITGRGAGNFDAGPEFEAMDAVPWDRRRRAGLWRYPWARIGGLAARTGRGLNRRPGRRGRRRDVCRSGQGRADRGWRGPRIRASGRRRFLGRVRR